MFWPRIPISLISVSTDATIKILTRLWEYGVDDMEIIDRGHGDIEGLGASLGVYMCCLQSIRMAVANLLWRSVGTSIGDWIAIGEPRPLPALTPRDLLPPRQAWPVGDPPLCRALGSVSPDGDAPHQGFQPWASRHRAWAGDMQH
jgi:hypothetical protein